MDTIKVKLTFTEPLDIAGFIKEFEITISADEAGEANREFDFTGLDGTGQDPTRQDKTRRDRTRRDATRQDPT